MKHTLLCITLLFIVQNSMAQEEKTKFGIKSGINIASFSASVNSEPKSRTGFHLGIYIKSPIAKRAYIRPELYFSGQGQKDNYIIPPNGPVVGKTTTTVNYLNAPLLFEIGRKFNFQFGPQLGILLSGKEEGTISKQKVNDDLKDVMKSSDISFVLGLGYSAGQHVNFGIRYNLGLTPIFEAPDGAPSDYPNIKNNVLHFFVGCSF